MQGLLDSEKSIPSLLYKYIESEKQRLDELKQLAQQYDKRNEQALATGTADISNPINAFVLIKQKVSSSAHFWQCSKVSGGGEVVSGALHARLGVRIPD
ncbi:unnamed protein product [Haemonchus placei]|uniref:P4Ha_N domain-containing protein n=1 Tax=Haemonchus placei TaxID=6290 RepID=A0A0N4VVM4_HAEPC|nr:unnamed protein product [Haemonchus placei]